MKNQPERIFLNIGAAEPDEIGDFKECHAVTWSQEKIYPQDIEYRLVVNPPQSENKEVMSLTQCMDKVARIEIRAISPNHNWDDWADWHRYIRPTTAQSFKAFRESAELYASQFQSRIKELEAEIERLKARL